MERAEYINQLEETLASLDRSASLIIRQAETLKNNYWDTAKKTPGTVRYSLSITSQDSGVRIRWGRIIPLKKSGGAKKFIMRHLRMTGNGYPAKAFQGADPKDLGLIMSYEEQFYLMREELKQNRAIRKLLSRRITENKKLL